MGGPDEKPAQLEFLTKLQRILGEGLFVASYLHEVISDE